MGSLFFPWEEKEEELEGARATTSNSNEESHPSFARCLPAKSSIHLPAVLLVAKRSAGERLKERKNKKG